MVFVFNNDGTRLMPCHPAKARILLKKKLAKVVKVFPFTIKLNYQIDNPKYQDTTIGIDPGKTIGISITTKQRVLIEAQLERRTDIPKLLEARRNARRTRHNRLRYRPPRFNNRRKIYAKQKEGWIPPSIQASLLTYINIIKFFNKYVNINEIRYEYNTFDIQKLKDNNIQGKQYQQGNLYQEENIKSYIRKRDNYTCQCCNKHIKDLKNINLQVHHIKPKSQGGTDVPSNLITLCEQCHKRIHEYLKQNKKIRFKIKEYKENTRLNILKDRIYKELIKLGYKVKKAYGYETKMKHIQLGLNKEHQIDARIIADNCYKRSKHDVRVYYMKKIRNHNRKIYKDRIYKRNKKRKNQSVYEIYEYRRYDIVKHENRYWYINGLRSSGSFQLKRLNVIGELNRNYKKMDLIQRVSKYIWS